MHHSQSSPLGRAGHPLAHFFDKTLPDPADKPTSVAHTEDYVEYFPEEDLVIHNHIHPRKSLYKPSEQETKAYKLGHRRLTEINPVKSEEPIDQWDCVETHRKRGDLWTGATYLFGSQHNEQTALAAVKRIRDKTAAKKQARQTGFYDVNQLSDGKGCMYRPTRGVVYDMSSFIGS